MGLKQLIQTRLAASWRNSRRLASWPHSWVPWSFPLSLGSYVILRGMLPSFRGHAHCCWDLSEIHEKESSSRILFSLVLSQSQETLGREDLFLRNWAKFIFEHFKWQNPVDSFAEGLPLDLFLVALFAYAGAIRTGESSYYWPGLFLLQRLGEKCNWHTGRTWRMKMSST